MADKVQLKEEIERRLSNLWYLIPEGEKVLQDNFTKEDANNLGKYTALESILQFIDSLPEEHNEDLKEEIQRAYYDKSLYDADNLDRQDFNNIAHHFAEWQKQKDEETIEFAEEHAMLAGMMKEREEIMKDAVEGVIDIRKWPAKAQVEFYDRLPVFNVKTGDKVKIVVLKTE